MSGVTLLEIPQGRSCKREIDEPGWGSQGAGGAQQRERIREIISLLGLAETFERVGR